MLTNLECIVSFRISEAAMVMQKFFDVVQILIPCLFSVTQVTLNFLQSLCICTVIEKHLIQLCI
jgi:hypothetical protein